MSRLRRQLKPYIAALRLSKAKFIFFIEGADFDPMFYGAIVHRYSSETGHQIEMRRATELPSNADLDKGGSGGRLTLLCASSLWEGYKRKHIHKWNNKKTLVFFTDRDVADHIGDSSSAPSVIPTPLHSVENHLFASTELTEALEVALSLAPGEAIKFIAAEEDWAKASAQLWKEWIAFCLVSLRLGTAGFSNYSSISLFNPTRHLPAVREKVESHFDRLRLASGINSQSFDQIRNENELFVDEMFRAGEYDRIFKGRWYLEILYSQLCASQFRPQAKISGKVGILVAIRSKFRLRDEDYRYYCDAINRVDAKNNNQ